MRIAYNSISPLTFSGYGRCTAELVYRLLDDHEVDVFAYYGLQKAEINTTLSGDRGEKTVKVIGGDGSVNHPLLPAAAPKYDLIISHWDLWMSSFNPQWFDSIKQKHVWWAILDSSPLPFPIRDLMTRDTMLCSIPMTEFGQKIMQDCPDIDENKVGPVISHGIDTEEWQPTEGGINGIPDDAEFVLCSVATNTMRENIPVMVEAFALFMKITEADAYYYIHTNPWPSGTGYFLHQVVKAVEEAYGVDLKKRILFKASSQRYPDEFMRQMYTRADINLLTILGGSFEIPILEAACCGTPTIVTDFSGPGEVVDHGSRGLVVQPIAPTWMNLSSSRQYQVDPRDVAQAIATYYEAPGLRRKHVRKMRNWIRENATWDIVADAWKQLLRQIEEETLSYGRPYYAGRDVDESEWKILQNVEGPVLEMGCGLGGLLLHLWMKDVEAVGVEVSDYAVQKCSERGLTVWQADAEALPFTEDTFRYAASQHLLEHCEDPLKAVMESLRVSTYGCTHIVPGHVTYDPTHKRTHFTREEIDELAYQLSDAGYEAVVYPEGITLDWVLEVKING